MIEVNISRKGGDVYTVKYLSIGELFNVHELAEASIEGLPKISVKEGDKFKVETVDTKTGNAIHTVVTRGNPTPF